MSVEDPPRTPLDFRSPSDFHVGRFLGRAFKAFEKLHGDAGSVVRCQLQGLVENFFDLSHLLNFTILATGA